MALNQKLDYYFLFEGASIPLTPAPAAAHCYPRHKTTYSIKVSIKLFLFISSLKASSLPAQSFSPEFFVDEKERKKT